jgi:hypothetical protein
MIILYHGGGSPSLEIDDDSRIPEQEDIYRNTCKLLIAREKSLAADILAMNDFQIHRATNDFGDDFWVLKLSKATSQYERWRRLISPEHEQSEEFLSALSDIASVIKEQRFVDEISGKATHIRFIVCVHNATQSEEETLDWRLDYLSRNISNQALFDFDDSEKLQKYGLHFRSKTEIKIYESLVSRGLFVLPLPVAILGKNSIRREPDFVVAYDGKIGVLEIHGEKWHPPETYAKESERRRQMRSLGVTVYEVFDSMRCWNDPEAVVEEFLSAFETGS